MPLLSGAKNVGRNIRELEQNEARPRSHKQIVAIALHAASVPGGKLAGAKKRKLK